METEHVQGRRPNGLWGRVLSIQSHTVHGYVGNKSAVFPLQLLGFDVDPINSVQFSNHTGYANGFTGDVLNGEQLTSLVQGLEKNGLIQGFSHLLTGYIGSISFLRNVLGVHQTLKKCCPNLVYFCDPVLGDKGKLYVPEELVAVYRSEVVAVANVLTPNQFELELLTETKVTDLESAKKAFSVLHARGVGTVILTSCEFEEHQDVLILLASISSKDGTGPAKLIQAIQPKLQGHFTGTGDLIAALLLAWTTRDEHNLEAAIRKACTSMHAVVSRTRAGQEAGVNPNNEIFLIQSREDIEAPDVNNSPIQVTVLAE